MFVCQGAEGESKADTAGPSLTRAPSHGTWARAAGQVLWQQQSRPDISSVIRQVQGCQAGKLSQNQGTDQQGARPGARHLQEGTEDESLSLKAIPKRRWEPHWDLAAQLPPMAHFKARHLHPVSKQAQMSGQPKAQEGEYHHSPDKVHTYMSADSQNGHIYFSMRWCKIVKVLTKCNVQKHIGIFVKNKMLQNCIVHITDQWKITEWFHIPWIKLMPCHMLPS